MSNMSFFKVPVVYFRWVGGGMVLQVKMFVSLNIVAATYCYIR